MDSPGHDPSSLIPDPSEFKVGTIGPPKPTFEPLPIDVAFTDEQIRSSLLTIYQATTNTVMATELVRVAGTVAGRSASAKLPGVSTGGKKKRTPKGQTWDRLRLIKAGKNNNEICEAIPGSTPSSLNTLRSRLKSGDFGEI